MAFIFSPAHRAKRLLAEDGGVAAVEMALISPVALLFLSLVVAGGQSLTLYHRTVETAHTVTDLVSQSPFVPDTLTNTTGAELLDEAQLDQDLKLSQLIYYPNDATNLKVVLSELKVDANSNQGTVVWSEGCNSATALTVGTVLNLDPSYVQADAGYLLYGQVSNVFQPLGIMLNVSPINLSATEVLAIRNALQITVNWSGKTC